ncbi:MAG TPA: long-chain fatty acid--CoA ligase [Bacteroidetes bacterium]|nr:long-chain fatty acid--CoA ligase [Bacteroidota bacterium]
MEPSRTFDLLDRYMLYFPDKTDALAEKKDGKWIYYSARQYYELSHFFAFGMLEMGFNKGDKIITISNNRPQWNFVDMGMAMLGLIHVPVFTSMTCNEYRYVFEHSEAAMVIVSDKKLYNAIKPVCDEEINIKYVFTFDEIEGVPNWKEIVDRGKNCGASIIQKAEKLKTEVLPGDPASLIYTSGTTGRAKGVMLSHTNLVRNFIAAAEVFRLKATDKYLSILPLCHVGGRMGNYQTQYSGASIYYAENMGTIASNLKEIQATGFDAVPRILEKVYDNVIAKGKALKGIKKKIFFWAVDLGLKYKPFGQKSWFYYRKLQIADKLIFSKWRDALGGKVRLVGCGGASLQARLERIFWAAGLKILNMYGLTETSPIITINRQEPPLCRLGSVGALIDGVEMKIADDGEILCRGHNVMLAYYKDKELTSQLIDEEGWFHTGDAGYIEDEKFLMVTDRKKDIFKLSNGKFVAPQIIENKLKESPFVDQVMVTGEHQKFASALLVPDFNYLKNWCIANGLYNNENINELISLPFIHELFSREINKLNKELSESEKILRFRLVADEWSPLSGELSASLKLKRQVIESKYSEIIDNIYRKIHA